MIFTVSNNTQIAGMFPELIEYRIIPYSLKPITKNVTEVEFRKTKEEIAGKEITCRNFKNKKGNDYF